MTKSRSGLSDTFGGVSTWFDSGSGQLRGHSRDSGLATDTDIFEDLAALCGEPQQAGIVDPGFCADLEAVGYSTDPSDYNIPSITNSRVVGGWTTTRRFVNVTNNPQTFTTVLTRVPGFRTSVSPRTFTVGSGEMVELAFSFQSTGAPSGQWRFGQVAFRNSAGNLRGRIPISLQADDFAAPSEVFAVAAGPDGAASYDVGFGFDGDFAAMGNGLYPPSRTEDNVVDDPANDINIALATGVGITVHVVNVPDGTLYSRFSLVDEYTDGDDDLDLYVFDPDGNNVGGSGGGTSAEEVNLLDPSPGDYFVVVHGWQTDGPDANYTLFDWQILPGGPGNLTVTGPTSAINGATGPVDYSWSGLDSGERYLGLVEYGISTEPPPTVLNVATE
jgi:hypothetical protein